MKLRLTQAGMQKFTGQMGSLVFEDGLSVTDVPAREAVRMAAVMGAVWEDGTSPSPAHALIESVSLAAPVVAPLARGEDAPKAQAPVVEVVEAKPAAPAVAPVTSYEELVKIADEKGIAGLRELAEPLGIKGRRVAELIEALAVKFELKPAAVDPVPEPVGDVQAQPVTEAA